MLPTKPDVLNALPLLVCGKVWRRPMAVTSRLYAGEDDYARMRQLLAEIEALEGPLVYCHVGDLDWWRFTDEDTHALATRIRLWFDHQGALVGFTWPSEHQVDLLVHPAYRAIEPAMLDWVEHLSRLDVDDPKPHVSVWSYEHDAYRNNLLMQRGYVRTDHFLSLSTRDLHEHVPEPEAPAGYTIRHVQGEADVHARVEAHRDAFASSRMSVAKYRAAIHAPTYRPDLDLIAVADNGSVAAFCTLWFDSINRIGEIEPLGCRAAHRRHGLARALVLEGLRRLQGYDAHLATVFYGSEPEDQPARQFYASLGFIERGRMYAWKRG
ncbi:MAG: N-acetyltransferase [Roseiflexus sp.]|nr:MAG: N-acetyltransferase [Roseiflexus sp.]